MLSTKSVLRGMLDDHPVELGVEQFIGNGGTGEVWAAADKYQYLAVKWFYPFPAIQQLRSNLNLQIKLGSPSAEFCWPISLLDADEGSFGIAMPMRSGRFVSLADLLLDRVQITDKILRQAAIRICQAWELINARHFGLTDLSLKNVLLDPNSGEVCLCDLDGLLPWPEGCAALVSASPLFPSVNRFGHAPESTSTNNFALAAVLFVLLVRARPDEDPSDAGRKCNWETGFHRAAEGLNLLAGKEPAFGRWLALRASTREKFSEIFGNSTGAVVQHTPTKWIEELGD